MSTPTITGRKGLPISPSRNHICVLLLLTATPLVFQAPAAAQGHPSRQTQPQAEDPRFDDALQRAQTAQSAGRYGEAAQAYAEATALDRRLPELWANRGLMEHLAGQCPAAITSFEHALALKPALFTPQLFLGLDALELGKFEFALPHLERARALRPDDPQAVAGLGRAYTALHKPAAAAAAYTAATVIDPSNQTAWYGLGTAAVALIEQDGATLANRHPDSVWARALYADELLMQGRTTEAFATYHQVAALAAPFERTLFHTNLQHLRDSPAAPALPPESWASLLAILEPGGQTAPACTAAQTLPGRQMACLYWQNQPATSATVAAQRLEHVPADPEALFWSVKSNERRAVDALARFEQLAPQSAATYDLLGDLDRRRMQPDSALDQYAKALAISPRDPGALLGRAAAFLAIGKTDQAIEAARIALTDRPEDPRLNLLLGEALVTRHSYPEAQPYLQKALAASTNGAASDLVALAPRAHALEGRVEAEAGQTDAAIADMILGLPSDQDGSLSFQLSRLYRRAGRFAEAQAAETNAKALQARRRANAITAVESSLSPTP